MSMMQIGIFFCLSVNGMKKKKKKKKRVIMASR